jgi:hypothetical protein
MDKISEGHLYFSPFSPNFAWLLKSSVTSAGNRQALEIS